MSRREFIKGGAVAIAAPFLSCPGLAGLSAVDPVSYPQGPRRLLVVELSGGNDGLNTVVPCRDPAYYDMRRGLSLHRQQLLPLSADLALNGSMMDLHSLWLEGQLAIIQAVGHPSLTRSHCRAKEIWRTGQPDCIGQTSWLERCLDGSLQREFSRDSSPSKPVVLNQAASASLSLADRHVEFAQALHRVSSLIFSGIGSGLFTVSLGGFDTHANQLAVHNALLAILSQCLGMFHRNLKDNGLDRSILTLVLSEFGRRAYLNSEGGTDHGLAGPVFVIGTAVKGGIYGQQPPSAGAGNGDLPCLIDFRRVYATIIDGWLKADSRAVLGNSFAALPFL